jgi:protein-tyrosine-phosphatase
MAASLLERTLEQSGLRDIEVLSAGIGAWEGAPASEGAYLVMLEDGLDLSAHRARLLTPELIESADLILTMSRSHLGRVRELGAGSRAHLLGEFAGRAGDRAEIKDPFGAELEQYRETYRELAGLMPAVAERLAGRA